MGLQVLRAGRRHRTARKAEHQPITQPVEFIADVNARSQVYAGNNFVDLP